MANEELQAQSRAVRDLTREGLDIAPVDDSFPALTQDELTAAASGKTVIDNSNNIVLNFLAQEHHYPIWERLMVLPCTLIIKEYLVMVL